MNDQSTSELDFIKGLLIDAIRAADAIPKPALNLWFAHLKIESISDSTAILAVENEFISKKIQSCQHWIKQLQHSRQILMVNNLNNCCASLVL